MTFDELDAVLREAIKAQPYGFQSKLSRELNVSRSYINHVVSGRSPISREHYQTILNELNLEIDLKPKS